MSSYDENYEEVRGDLERLGMDLKPGCRTDVLDEAIHVYGLKMEDIVCKFSDEDVVRAVHSAFSDYSIFELMEEHE
jgi:hypothetical protein